MGLGNRRIRAAGSALLVAAAVGAGGMTGMASALAADPLTVALNGSLVDDSGAPLGGVHLTIVEELPPDGGIAAFPVTTASDGSFSADVYAWGTEAAPASVTISTAPDESIVVEADSCSRTWSVTVADHRDLALAEVVPDTFRISAATALLGEVCGTTGTPGAGSSGGNDSGAGSGSTVTPPPTDVSGALRGTAQDRTGSALTIGFLIGIALAGLLLVPRPGSRRRS